MKVKPAPGRAVRDPSTMQLLDDNGGIVPDDDPFWTRRVLDEDVEVMPDDPPPETLSGAAAGGRGKPAADPRQPSAPASGPSKEA